MRVSKAGLVKYNFYQSVSDVVGLGKKIGFSPALVDKNQRIFDKFSSNKQFVKFSKIEKKLFFDLLEQDKRARVILRVFLKKMARNSEIFFDHDLMAKVQKVSTRHFKDLSVFKNSAFLNLQGHDELVELIKSSLISSNFSITSLKKITEVKLKSLYAKGTLTFTDFSKFVSDFILDDTMFKSGNKQALKNILIFDIKEEENLKFSKHSKNDLLYYKIINYSNFCSVLLPVIQKIFL